MTTRERFMAGFTLLPPSLQKTKKIKSKGGRSHTETYVDREQYILRANMGAAFPDGFDQEMTPYEVGNQLIVKCRITDCRTGNYKEDLGYADKGKDFFGGAMAEASAQALKRALSHFGVGLGMYFDEDEKADAWEYVQDGVLDVKFWDDKPEPKPEPAVKVHKVDVKEATRRVPHRRTEKLKVKEKPPQHTEHKLLKQAREELDLEVPPASSEQWSEIVVLIERFRSFYDDEEYVDTLRKVLELDSSFTRVEGAIRELRGLIETAQEGLEVAE